MVARIKAVVISHGRAGYIVWTHEGAILWAGYETGAQPYRVDPSIIKVADGHAELMDLEESMSAIRQLARELKGIEIAE